MSNMVTSIGEVLFDVYPERKTLGGASFNFLYHIKKLTGKGNFISRIGNDEEGKQILGFLKSNNISTDYIQIDPVHPTGESIAKLNELKIPAWEIKTGCAYDFIELNDNINSLIENNTRCLYYGTLAQRNAITRNTIRNFFNRELIYFCDLNIRQNFYTEELITECISACDILKVNIEEMHLINKLMFKKEYNSIDTPKLLINKFHLKLLCISRGEEGADIYFGEKYNHIRYKVDNVADTVGAGDAYAAVLCLGYMQNWDIEKINYLATEFASEIVKINGALPQDSLIYEKYKGVISATDP